MAKDIDNFDDDEMDESAAQFFDEESSEENAVPVVRDYSERRILVWEEDDARRNACLEVLSDLLVGATIKAVKTEDEANEQIENDDWDTFVVDFYTEGVSSTIIPAPFWWLFRWARSRSPTNATLPRRNFCAACLTWTARRPSCTANRVCIDNRSKKGKRQTALFCF